MLTPEEEAAFRQILRERAETRDLTPDQIHFSPAGVPDLPQDQSFFWQLIDCVNNFPVWLGKTRGGKVVCAVVVSVGIWQSLDWIQSRVIFPVAGHGVIVAECLDRFIATEFGERFPSSLSGKEKYLAFSNPPNPPVDILIPATSGIVPDEVINQSLPPALPYRGFNNSQQVARITAEMMRRRNRGSVILPRALPPQPSPVLPWGGFNNSQQIARINADIRRAHDQTIRNNRRNQEMRAAAWLALQQQQQQPKQS
jgi:hypothetical protein